MSLEIPTHGQRTVCELDCALMQSDADALPLPGVSYPCIHIQPRQLPEAMQPQAYVRIEGSSAFREVAAQDILPSPSSSQIASSSASVAAAWHPHKATVAVADSMDRVHVFDMAAFEASSQQAPKNGASPAAPAVLDQARMVLQHGLQKQVGCLAWRPRSGSVLAVGCKGGVALWSTCGTSKAPVAGSRGANTPMGPWVTFLQELAVSGGFASKLPRILDLAWSPDGRLLAGASADFSGLLIWDVALGTSVRVAAGFSSLRKLAWSRDGNYLFAGSYGSLFYMYETSRWSYQSWDAAAGMGLPLAPIGAALGSAIAAGEQTTAGATSWAGRAAHTALSLLRSVASAVTAATSAGRATGATGSSNGSSGVLTNVYWAPGGKVVLMSFAGSKQLLSLHIIGEPPSLTAHMMPVVLPDVSLEEQPRNTRNGSSDSRCAAAASSVVDFTWDPRGERLGVLLQVPHPAAGCVALFATSSDPVVEAHLLGYARPPPLQNEVPEEGAQQAGGSSDPQPAASTGKGMAAWRLSSHQCFQHGALFTLRMGEHQLYNLPMHFRQ